MLKIKILIAILTFLFVMFLILICNQVFGFQYTILWILGIIITKYTAHLIIKNN